MTACVRCAAATSHHAEPGVSGCRCGAPTTLAAFRRIEADLTRRRMLGGTAATLGLFAGFGLAPRRLRAQEPGRPLLLTNLRLFDGKASGLREEVDILVRDGRIADLPRRGEGPEEAERIDCGGRAVIPGLIDCHWHATLVGVTELTALTAPIAYIHLVAAQSAADTLRRGFTTVRDVGGPAFALKRAIDEGIVEGPRIFPSGAMISQTSGHGDLRMLHEVPRAPGDPLSYTERAGLASLADGPDQVLLRVREQLMQGASQIKMMAGGGVSSHYDPIDTMQYTERELRAGVEAAEDWGTYVCVHVYTAAGIKRAVRAGVKSIEHGQLTDEETVRMMAGEGVWWSLQPFLDDEDANPKPLPEQRRQQAMIAQGTERAYEWSQKHDVRTAWGTDILMNPAGGATQGRQLAKLTRFYDPLTALRSATGDAGDLLALSGPRAPYPGALGVIAPGAMADLLVVEGDPAVSLDFLGDPDSNLRLIMKGGRIHKDEL